MILTKSSSKVDVKKYGGGKAYHLRKLDELNARVPEWICLGTSFFQEFILKNSIDTSRLPNEDWPTFEKRISETFISGSLPQGHEDLLRQAFKDHHFDIEQMWFAVRSSGNDEDSQQASFAGQLSTFLFQKNWNDILLSIKKCWASGFSARSMIYRQEKHLSTSEIKVSVIIQKMLFPQAAGICFTRNPINPLDRDNLLLSSSWGVGEGIVSGMVESDEIKVTRSDLTNHEVNVATKITRLDFDTVQKLGVIEIKNEEEKSKTLSLTQEKITEIADLALKIESHEKCSQDIEFAIENNQLYILQTRPITHLPIETFYNKSIMGEDINLWDNSNIIESYSGVTAPLTFSFASYAYQQVYRQFMEVMGLPKKDILKSESIFRNLLGLHRGRIYYNLICWYKLVLMLPGSENNKEFLETMMGVKTSLDQEAQKLFDNLGVDTKKTSLSVKLKVFFMTFKNFVNIDEIVHTFQSEFNKTYLDVRKKDLSKLSLTESMNLYNFLEEDILTNWKAPIINDYLCMIFFGLLKKLTDKWINLDTQGLQNDLLCGEGDLESTEPTKMLMRMAKKIDLEDGPLKKKLLSTKAQDLLDDKDLVQEINPFLEKFGFRCANELKLEEPDLHDDPSFIIHTLSNYIKMKSYDIEKMETREKEIRSHAEDKARKHLSFFKEKIYFWVLKHARKAVKNRENLRFLRTKIFGITRHLMRGIGHRLHELHILHQPTHLFYLKIEEIRGFIEGRSLGENLAEIAKERFLLFEDYRKNVAPPDRFMTKGGVGMYNFFPSVLSQLDLLKDFGVSDDPYTLNGTPCSPGIVEGTVRVAKEFSDAENLSGDILVTERTDPGWVPLYPSCSGLLIERGSLLSHSAVVARELGLPTIIGINGGLLQKLKTGDRIKMDASTGIIKIIHHEKDVLDESINHEEKQ